jgi:hypothetical protein
VRLLDFDRRHALLRGARSSLHAQSARRRSGAAAVLARRLALAWQPLTSAAGPSDKQGPTLSDLVARLW